MTVQEAINTAVAAGYHIKGSDGMDTDYEGANSEFSVWTRQDNESSFLVPVEETFLDARFWQAFGHALAVDGVSPYADWKTLWHHFIDHLSQGGTPPAFFQQLACPSPASHRGVCGTRHHEQQTKTRGKITTRMRTLEADHARVLFRHPS